MQLLVGSISSLVLSREDYLDLPRIISQSYLRVVVEEEDPPLSGSKICGSKLRGLKIFFVVGGRGWWLEAVLVIDWLLS